MSEHRLIDANELYGIESLLNTDIIRNSKEASWLMSQVLYDIQSMPTINTETLPIVQDLRNGNKRLKAVVKVQLEQIREKTAEIDELCEKVADLDEKMQWVTTERDAAVSDIETAMAYPNDNCQFCKNAHCQSRNGTKPCMPKWRGAQKDE